MALPFGLDFLFENIGLSFEWTIILISLLGVVFTFFAKNFKLGMSILVIMSAGLFVWFYEQGFNWSIPLILMLIFIVILVLSLIAVNKSSQKSV